MAPAKKSEKITVVAELEVTSPEGVETIRHFDKAWRRMRELAKVHGSASVSFIQFTRID